MFFRQLRRLAIFSAALLIVCAFGAVAQDRAAAKAEGVRIHMGEGHFNRDGKAFHYWDNEKEVPAACARCHSAVGLPQYLKEGKNTPAPHVKNAFACTNCHADMLTYQRHTVDKVTFPSGISVNSADNTTNLCMSCHQGRESTASLDKQIAGMEPDTPNPKIPFVHVHYYPAGATVYGTDAKVAYEYPGKVYAGRYVHDPEANGCTACHDSHSGAVRVDNCTECHRAAKDRAGLATIRKNSKGDFDGNGREEGLGRELANMKVQIYAAIRQYARTVGGASIAFSPGAYPYWYTDTNGNGNVDPDEMQPNNPYKSYTPRLLQAVFNYTYLLRDPGAAYHNGAYALQIAHDTLQSLADSGKAGADMRGKARP